MAQLRIMIADDHPLFRNGIATLLKATPDMEVVGEAATGDGLTNAEWWWH